MVVNVIGLSAHLWCFKLFKVIGDACGDFLDVSCNLVLIAFLDCFSFPW